MEDDVFLGDVQLKRGARCSDVPVLCAWIRAVLLKNFCQRRAGWHKKGLAECKVRIANAIERIQMVRQLPQEFWFIRMRIIRIRIQTISSRPELGAGAWVYLPAIIFFCIMKLKKQKHEFISNIISDITSPVWRSHPI